MKRKGLFLLLLALVLMASMVVMVGCGQSADTDEEIVTVTFSYPPYGYDSEKEDAFWTTYIAQFEEENPNIKIDMTIESWDNVYTKWEEYWSTGDTPDIGYCDGADAVELGLADKALPVTDVVEALGGSDKFSEDCSKLYCLPCFGIPHRFIGSGRLY